ncbi:MAG: pyridoxamine 5'-phosphate oxidase family protein [Acidimicrobiales bacterium]
MYDDEQRELTATATSATLFARRHDQSPTGWPMTPLWPGDGHLYFNTYRVAAKAKMMLRDDRVAVLLSTEHAPRGLRLQAQAQLITDADEIEWLAQHSLRTDGFATSDVVARTQDRLRSGKRVLFRMAALRLDWIPLPPDWRTDARRSQPRGARTDMGKAGRDRGSLALEDDELASFVEVSRAASVGWISPEDHPTAAALAVRPLGERLELGEGAPPPGTRVCVVLDRGATYADIEGAMIHGDVAADHTVAVADVVSFAFAKASGGS